MTRASDAWESLVLGGWSSLRAARSVILARVRVRTLERDTGTATPPPPPEVSSLSPHKQPALVTFSRLLFR